MRDAGKLRTVIARRYTLDEIREAHRYADNGHKVGNVAVLIGDRADAAGVADAVEPAIRSGSSGSVGGSLGT